MQFVEQVLQKVSPGNGYGADFTASFAERFLPVKGSYLAELTLSLKGTTAATVASETFLDVLNPFVFKIGQETAIQLRGRDLVAYSYFMTGSTPHIIEGSGAQTDKISSIRIPLWLSTKDGENYSWAATRSAVANVSAEELGLQAEWHDKALEASHLVAVEQPLTTAGATGPTSLNVIIPQIGDLIGLIVFNTTVPTAAAQTFSLSTLKLLKNGQLKDVFTMANGHDINGGNGFIPGTPVFNILNNYRFFDFRNDPYDAKAERISIDVEVGVASEAVRIIPIMLRK